MIDDKVKIKCSKCSMIFRERAQNLRNGFQTNCRHCNRLITFDSSSEVVSNIPAGQFTAGESVVLAFKILGVHSEYGLPHGEFVAAHHCTRPDCLDFLR
jgi:hypothetical protein